MKKSAYFAFYILLFLAVTFHQCQKKSDIEKQKVENSDKIPLSKLNSLILDELKNKKIVMIGDYIHVHEAPYRTLLNFLYYWINNLEKNVKGTPEKIVLFLEVTPKVKKTMDHFFKTGDFSHFLNLWTDMSYQWNDTQFNIDLIENLFNLKDLIGKIEKLKNKNKKIDLLIEAAESDTPQFNYQRCLEKDNTDFMEEIFQYFAKERDKNSADNINMFMKEHKKYKALVFIGTAHLIRKKFDKSELARKRLNLKNDIPVFEYFLAHHLDEIFGRKNVSVFNFRGILKNQPEFILENPSMEDKNYDFEVSLYVNPPFPFPMPFLKSKKYLESVYDIMLKHSTKTLNIDTIYTIKLADVLFDDFSSSEISLNHEFKKKYEEFKKLIKNPKDFYRKNEDIFNYLGGLIKSFNSIINLKNFNKWFKRSGYPPSKRYWYQIHQIITSINKDYSYSWIRRYMDESFNFKFGDEELTKITKIADQIIQYSLIKLLWIGNEQEKLDAVNYLKSDTGEKYSTAKEFNNWWRAKYYSEIDLIK